MDKISSRVVKIEPLKDVWGKRKVHPGAGLTIGALLDPRSGKPTFGLKPDRLKYYQEHNILPAIGPGGDTKALDEWTLKFQIRLGDTSTMLHLDKIEDEFKYEVVKLNNAAIAPSRSEVKPKHRYVVIDEEKEATVVSKNIDFKLKAFTTLASMSLTEMSNMLKLYGIKIDTASPDLIKSKLAEYIEVPSLGAKPSGAVLFMEKYEDKDRKLKVLLTDAKRLGIYTVKNGMWYQGKDMIASTEERLIELLKSPDKRDDLEALRQLVEDAYKAQVSSQVR